MVNTREGCFSSVVCQFVHLSPGTSTWRNSRRGWHSPLSKTANSSSFSWLLTNFSMLLTRVYLSVLEVPHGALHAVLKDTVGALKPIGCKFLGWATKASSPADRANNAKYFFKYI